MRIVKHSSHTSVISSATTNLKVQESIYLINYDAARYCTSNEVTLSFLVDNLFIYFISTVYMSNVNMSYYACYSFYLYHSYYA